MRGEKGRFRRKNSSLIVQVTVMKADRVKLHVIEANAWAMAGVSDFWVGRRFFFREFERV